MSGQSYQSTDGRRTDDHSPVETGTADSDGDPFEDDDVTSVLDAA
ncbi:hypothetical protein [Haloarcula sediminis]|nr:hypothetical protein [Haloarcula sp. CK38]